MSIFLILFGLTAVRSPSQAEPAASKPQASPRFYERVAGVPADQSRGYWDRVYATETYVFGKQPSKFLVEALSKVSPGTALDIAMGEGRNAIYLAKKGFRVEGVDISQVALRKARRWAKKEKLSLTLINEDLSTYAIAKNKYDLIINIDYLQRSLIPRIKAGLRVGGFVIFENATTEQLKISGQKGTNPDYLLKPDELKSLFEGFEILIYREKIENNTAKAYLLARKKG